MKLAVKPLTDTAALPTYATPGAACFDIAADLGTDPRPEDYKTDPKGANTMVVGTGLAFCIPEGWAMLLFSRSGHGFKQNQRLANCVGVIDSDYRGEVKVKLARDDQGEIKVTHGERIAQAMLVPVERVEFYTVSSLDETERGSGGFGSTGA